MPSVGNETNHTIDGLTVRGGLALGANGPYVAEGDVFSVFPGTNSRPGGIETLPRWGLAQQTFATGQLRISWFTSAVTRTITQMAFTPTTTAASGTTLIRYGLYRLEQDNSATLVASTANDTTLLPTLNVESTKALSASYTVLAGVRYGAALVQVGGTVGTPIGLNTSTFAIAMLPLLATVLTSQTDLPATITAAQNAGNAQNPYCFLS